MNDGIVGFDSMRWTKFTEFGPEDKRKGLSHADVVDLRRRDRWGFDIRAFYRSILEALGEMGL